MHLLVVRDQRRHDQVAVEIIRLCHLMVVVLVVHDQQALVHLFDLDNLERALDLDNDQVLFLVVDLSRHVMELQVEVVQVAVTMLAVERAPELVLAVIAQAAQAAPAAPAERAVPVDQGHAVAVQVKRAGHLVAVEKVGRPIANRNLERLAVKRSIIYEHPLLVALSSHVVMAQR